MKKNILLATNFLVCAALLAACGSKAADSTSSEKKSSNTVKVEKSSSSSKKQEKEEKASSVLDMFNEELASSGKSTEEVYVTGDITVGEDGDVKPGIYDLQVTGGDGYVTIDHDELYYFYSSFSMAAPGTEYSYSPSSVRVILFDGMTIEFSDISKVRFTAVGKDVTPSNELGIGNFIVGRDIKPGTYKLSSSVSLDTEYSSEWDLTIYNFDSEKGRDQSLSKENSDVAVKLEEGEVITVQYDNWDSEVPTDKARLIFTSVE